MLKALSSVFRRSSPNPSLKLAPFFSYFDPNEHFFAPAARHPVFDANRSKLEPELLRCLEPYEVLNVKHRSALGHNDAMWMFGSYQQALDLPDHGLVQAAADQGHLQAKLQNTMELCRDRSKAETVDIPKIVFQILEESPQRAPEMIDLLVVTEHYDTVMEILQRYSKEPGMEARYAWMQLTGWHSVEKNVEAAGKTIIRLAFERDEETLALLWEKRAVFDQIYAEYVARQPDCEAIMNFFGEEFRGRLDRIVKGGKKLEAFEVEMVLKDSYRFFNDSQKRTVAEMGWRQEIGIACEYLGEWYEARGELKKAAKCFWDGRGRSRLCALKIAKAFLSAWRSPFGPGEPIGWQLLAAWQSGESLYRLAMDVIASRGKLPIAIEEDPMSLLKRAGNLGCTEATNEYLRRRASQE
jgi:hypothetical protein